MMLTVSKALPRTLSRKSGALPRRCLSTPAAASLRTSKSSGTSSCPLVLIAGGLGLVAGSSFLDNWVSGAFLPTPTLMAASPLGGEVIQSGTPTKEEATGILFPQLCNGYYLAGTGVRVKYGFIKVYAVGSYFDPLSLSAVKSSSKESIEQALMDPTYPRTIRIVMNRGLSVEKFTSAIVEALEPRMKGKDLEKLEEFKKLNPPVDLVKGAEIEMTIRGDTLLYKNATGGVGTIRSKAFTEAMCDVYYGPDPVSPTHKDAVLAGIPKL